jgi:hypothetical protein
MADYERKDSRNPRPKWRDWLARCLRSSNYPSILDDDKGRERGEQAGDSGAKRSLQSGTKGNSSRPIESNEQSLRDSKQVTRVGGVGTKSENAGGVETIEDFSGTDSEEEETTGVIELNLAEARRRLDSACDK